MVELIQEKKFNSAIIKSIILAILGLVAIYFFGSRFKLFLADFEKFQFLFFSLLAFAVFLIIFFLQVVFIQGTGQSNFIIFLEAVVLFLSLANFSKPVLVGVFLFFLLLLFTNFAAQREINNGLKINFLKINRVVFGEAITALSLLLSIIAGVVLFNFFNQQTFDVQKFIQKLTVSFSKMSEKILPNEIATNILKETIKEQLSSDPKFQALSLDQKEKIVEEVFKQKEKEMGGKLEINAIFEKEGEVFFKELTNNFLKMPPQTKIYIVIGLGFIIFFILKGIGVILTWPLTFITFLIYELLLATNFARISIEQREKETINL